MNCRTVVVLHERCVARVSTLPRCCCWGDADPLRFFSGQPVVCASFTCAVSWCPFRHVVLAAALLRWTAPLLHRVLHVVVCVWA